MVNTKSLVPGRKTSTNNPDRIGLLMHKQNVGSAWNQVTCHMLE